MTHSSHLPETEERLTQRFMLALFERFGDKKMRALMTSHGLSDAEAEKLLTDLYMCQSVEDAKKLAVG